MHSIQSLGSQNTRQGEAVAIMVVPAKANDVEAHCREGRRGADQQANTCEERLREDQRRPTVPALPAQGGGPSSSA